MGEPSMVLNLILLAVAIGVFLKLRSVLGRRTGNERPPYDPFTARDKPALTPPSRSDDGKVVTLPKRPASDQDDSGIDAYPQREPYVVKNRWATVAQEGSPLAKTLGDIAAADRGFDAEAFLAGARTAYEMIVTAFAAGDRKTLTPLLDKPVYDSFENVIASREARGERVEQTFIGISKAELTEASLKDRNARLTVRFVSELTSCVKNRDDVVIEGDPVTVRHVTDVWTFERDVTARDPNWRLAATGSEG